LTEEAYKTEIVIEQISYLNQVLILQQLCIIFIFQPASIGGNYLSNKTDNVDFQWKTITDYEKRIENEMESKNFKNNIYLTQRGKSNDFSKLLLKKNLKRVFKKHKSSDLKQDVGGKMRLTLFREQMSLFIDQALSKMPKENKKKETTITRQNNEMKSEYEAIHVTRKKTNADKSQLIWLRVN
jgi:hypothetical protein